MANDDTLRTLGVVALFVVFIIAAFLFILSNKPLGKMTITSSFSCPDSLIVNAKNSTGPLPTVALTLIDGDGNVVASSQTGLDGNGTLIVSSDGSYTLKAEKATYSSVIKSISLTPSKCTSTTATTTTAQQETPQSTTPPSPAPLDALMIVAILSIIVFIFHVIMFLSSKLISSSQLESMAKAGAIDAVFTFVIGFIMISLITTGALKDFTYKALNFVFTPPSSITNLDEWYGALSTSLRANLSSAIYAVDSQLNGISMNSGSISFSYAGSGPSPIDALTGSGSNKSSKGGQVAASITSAPSSTTTYGIGGVYTFFTSSLSSLRNSLSMLFFLSTSIDVLKNLANSPVFILPLFYLGMVLRGFNFSKGGGSFLMAFALTVHFLFPAGLVLGMQMVQDYTALSSISSIEGITSSLDVAPATSSFLSSVTRRIVFPFSIFDGEDAYNKASSVFTSNMWQLPFLLAAYILVLGFSLTIVVSGSGGLAKLLGADISVWIIGQLAGLV
ncbi:MAG: hypothetical protein D6769_03490 [Methanobacteriota archaeon]|nr:MAG: hypothetical protein D6769_03490 [Euryarchaeota archaeon]